MTTGSRSWHAAYISKETFLLAFKAAFEKIFILENVCVEFEDAELVLYNSDVVLLKLNIQLRNLD